MKDIVLGIDIGGSHITAALVDLGSRTLVEGSLYRRTVDCKGTAAEIFAAWAEVIVEAYSQHTDLVKRIGIAMPGPFDYEQGISLIENQDKFRSLFKLNVKEGLASLLQMEASNIKMLNDAASFLQGEAFAGAARGGEQVIGLTLGTGLGSAFCNQGVAIDAALWQSPFKDGIAEDYLSTRWFVDRYFELTGLTVKGVRELREIEGQEASCEVLFSEFASHLSEFLVPLIKTQQADMVVLGGNISRAHDTFLDKLAQHLAEQQLTPVLKIAELKEKAALLGAASCWEPDRQHRQTAISTIT